TKVAKVLQDIDSIKRITIPYKGNKKVRQGSSKLACQPEAKLKKQGFKEVRLKELRQGASKLACRLEAKLKK
ncbi:MAG TPA: hypothetical protein IAA29_09395, partial [Candidatus Paenibacillus intestinavium]|nr:hypothetical protein [Candidatus Paenibacillus intestinavium]